MLRQIQIIFTFILILATAGISAQVHIGDGVTVKKGTSFVIQNQDVHLNTEEIKGEGSITISNDNEQQISVNSKLNTTERINITAENTVLNGKYASVFIPERTDNLAIEQNQTVAKNSTEDLPVRYVNTEGLVYGSKEKKKAEDPVFRSLQPTEYNGVLVTSTAEFYAVDLPTDYIIPIYSFTLNDERFSDYAELYEFESLTAILKPPIV